MQKHIDITRRRVQAFLSPQRLGSKIYMAVQPVKLAVYHAPDRIPYADAVQAEYEPLAIGDQFAPLWSTHWVRVDYAIPEAWRGGEVHLLWDSSSEACVWIDGQPQQGLTGTEAHPEEPMPIRTKYRLTPSAIGSETGRLYIEAAVNTLFGVSSQPFQQTGLLRRAELALFDREAWDLYWDVAVIVGMALGLPQDSPRAYQALDTANRIVNAVDPDDRSTWAAGRELAAAFLAERNGDSQHRIYAVGHAHIDTAWLWPLAETKRKCVRTFSTALRNIEDYPDFLFVCSQAQQYDWIKHNQPDLYEQIKAAVTAGRFIPVGGTWVEPDCNIPSGESLVRQFLYGQRFFEQEFGIRCEEFWLPDTFGYPPALPQIMRGAGIKYFLTQKLSWNQFNKPNRSTFIWEGLDGSQVLTHFPPADSYNAVATVPEVVFSVRNFKDHEHSRESMYVFGYGDGGGGPTAEMLERLARMKDVDGLPRVEIAPPQAFFSKIAEKWDDYTTWVGELYFEMHRGTYTSQARNKKHNRACELLLRDVELLSVLAPIAYPQAEIERLWKLVLLNQFHDILPGSSIDLVYQDSEAQYAEIEASAAALRQAALDALIPPAAETPNHITVVNTLPFARTEVIEVEGVGGAQQASDGKGLFVVDIAALAPKSIAPDQAEPFSPVTVTHDGNTFVLESEAIRAVFRADGRLISLTDKTLATREAIAPEGGNQFIIYDDNPINWDAWDVDVFHLETKGEPLRAASAEVVEAGPVRVSIRFTYEISPRSRIVQTVSLTCAGKRLDFDHTVDWHEKHKLLKLEFPVTVRADYATYEMQYGHVRRPTHFNTSYDLARFEVPAHRWVDFSEYGFGVTLLNDCKYGFSVHGNTMRLSVLRAPTNPDPTADMGTHSFRCALYTHDQFMTSDNPTAEGLRFNVPLLVQPTAERFDGDTVFSVSGTLVIDAVKQAEDSDDIIVRLYESHGGRGTAVFRSVLPLRRAALCNLLEEPTTELEVREGAVELDYAPFQLITLRLSR